MGDILPMTPTTDDGFVIRAVEPEWALVLGDPTGSATWAFALAPVDEATTRLVTRVRAGFDSGAARRRRHAHDYPAPPSDAGGVDRRQAATDGSCRGPAGLAAPSRH